VKLTFIARPRVLSVVRSCKRACKQILAEEFNALQQMHCPETRLYIGFQEV